MLHLLKNSWNLSWDLMLPVNPQQILSGKCIFRPFMKFQQAWINHIRPGVKINTNQSVWSYLQKYMLPLIKKYASSYHLQGIKALELDTEKPPDFITFQQRFREVSEFFSIEPVNDEINARDYFKLISQKRFPCIPKLRAHNELFCGNEPDFWHEAIGHIAPLCYPAVQDFYLQVADYMLSARSNTEFKRHLAVAWTLMEYGFIKEINQHKMFGAALVGSHLANIRYEYGLINVERAKRDAIIASGFYEENQSIPRNSAGKIRFFCIDELNAQPYF